MSRILVIGEVNADLILHGYEDFPAPGREVLVEDSRLTLGSASAICAAGLARLGNEVQFIGRVGNDVMGNFCLDTMRDKGIDVSPVIRDPKEPTGITVSITSSRDRALVTHLGAIRTLTAEDLAGVDFSDFDHVHVSAYFLQHGLRPGCGRLFERASISGSTTSLDPGFDPSEEWGKDLGLGETLANVDLFFPNEIELKAITGHSDPLQAMRALENGRTVTVAKLGGKGAMAIVGDDPIRVKAPSVATLDTTGAGDSFNAGFLHGWLQKRPLGECLRYGVACGTLSTRGLGGTGAQADSKELQGFLKELPHESNA
jgi:sugar/nucleoside kinase (ribokinase family)